MSKASTSATVMFIPRLGTFTTMITATCGDVRQFYDDSTGAVSYSPDFTVTANQPTLEFVWWNSRGTTYTLTSIKWYFNNVELFTSGDTDGVWQKVSGQSTKIKLIGNPGTMTGNVSAVLKAEAEVSTPRGSIKLTSQIPVSLMRGSTNAYIVLIKKGGGATDNTFTITSTDPNDNGYACYLAPQVYKGGTDITSQCHYKWYRYDGTTGTWVEYGSDSSAILTDNVLEVENGDVESWGQFKLEAYSDSAKTQCIGFDVQEVLDTSDPMYIEYDLSNNGTIEERTYTNDSAGNAEKAADAVTVTPKLVHSGSGRVETGKTFYFQALDTSMNVLNTDSVSTASATFDVTVDMALQCGADVRVVITLAS